MKTYKTVKYLTFAELKNDKKVTYTKLQRIVLKVSKKDPIKDYKRGYYCTNICDWKYSNLIVKKGKFYRLTRLGELYLKDPQKANLKIRVNNLLYSRDRWRNRAEQLYYDNRELNNKNTCSKEVQELRDENYNLSYKLNEIKDALTILKKNCLPW